MVFSARRIADAEWAEMQRDPDEEVPVREYERRYRLLSVVGTIVWLVWLAGLIVGAVGAFWRPGGLHLGEWASVLVNFVLVPRRAVWKPQGGRG